MSVTWWNIYVYISVLWSVIIDNSFSITITIINIINTTTIIFIIIIIIIIILIVII